MGQAFHRRYVRGSRALYLLMVGHWDEALAFANAFVAEAEESPHYLVPGNLRSRGR